MNHQTQEEAGVLQNGAASPEPAGPKGEAATAARGKSADGTRKKSGGRTAKPANAKDAPARDGSSEPAKATEARAEGGGQPLPEGIYEKLFAGQEEGSRPVKVKPYTYEVFDKDEKAEEKPAENPVIDLISDIPLQVAVELGKTKKSINDILSMGIGSVIVLDKMAGELVEVVVNGKHIARGEVVVIDENYGVRITDIDHTF